MYTIRRLNNYLLIILNLTSKHDQSDYPIFQRQKFWQVNFVHFAKPWTSPEQKPTLQNLTQRGIWWATVETWVHLIFWLISILAVKWIWRIMHSKVFKISLKNSDRLGREFFGRKLWSKMLNAGLGSIWMTEKKIVSWQMDNYILREFARLVQLVGTVATEYLWNYRLRNISSNTNWNKPFLTKKTTQSIWKSNFFVRLSALYKKRD